MPFSCATTLRNGNPCKLGLPFAAIAHAVLGDTYDVSLVFAGDYRLRTLNRRYRHKDTTTNILSFALSKKSGEIIINPHRAAREARARNEQMNTYVIFLFVHGVLHLKGYRHGVTMEKAEQKLIKKFLKK